MPVFSYLVYPVRGAKDSLFNDLTALDYCKVIPAENEDILILVTDAPNDKKEQELQREIKQVFKT